MPGVSSTPHRVTKKGMITNPGQLRRNVSRAMRKLLDKKLIADAPTAVMEERMIDFAWTLVDWRTFDSVGRALCCTPLPLPHLPTGPLTRPNAVEPAADVPGLQPHC